MNSSERPPATGNGSVRSTSGGVASRADPAPPAGRDVRLDFDFGSTLVDRFPDGFLAGFLVGFFPDGPQVDMPVPPYQGGPPESGSRRAGASRNSERIDREHGPVGTHDDVQESAGGRRRRQHVGRAGG